MRPKATRIYYRLPYIFDVDKTKVSFIGKNCNFGEISTQDLHQCEIFGKSCRWPVPVITISKITKYKQEMNVEPVLKSSNNNTNSNRIIFIVFFYMLIRCEWYKPALCNFLGMFNPRGSNLHYNFRAQKNQTKNLDREKNGLVLVSSFVGRWEARRGVVIAVFIAVETSSMTNWRHDGNRPKKGRRILIGIKWTKSSKLEGEKNSAGDINNKRNSCCMNERERTIWKGKRSISWSRGPN